MDRFYQLLVNEQNFKLMQSCVLFELTRHRPILRCGTAPITIRSTAVALGKPKLRHNAGHKECIFYSVPFTNTNNQRGSYMVLERHFFSFQFFLILFSFTFYVSSRERKRMKMNHQIQMPFHRMTGTTRQSTTELNQLLFLFILNTFLKFLFFLLAKNIDFLIKSMAKNRSTIYS